MASDGVKVGCGLVAALLFGIPALVLLVMGLWVEGGHPDRSILVLVTAPVPFLLYRVYKRTKYQPTGVLFELLFVASCIAWPVGVFWAINSGCQVGTVCN